MAARSGITVTVKAPTNITVGVPDRRASALTNTAPVTLKSTARTISSLSDITDIDESSIVDGATLVYNSSTDKYEVRKITTDEVTITSLNGGTF